MGQDTHRYRSRRLAAATLLSTFAASAVVAQDYGLDFVTVGDAGNRDTLPHEVTRNPDLAIGGVDYDYRIMRTEVTAAQHFEFVNAVWPYLDRDQRLNTDFRGLWIRSATGDPDDPQYYVRAGKHQMATQMSFRTAAMFANWLHNGKADGAWAIADGAYDASTFGEDANGFLTDQERHHPDARVWLPTMDEMAKATYWDPDKDNGDGGYWLYPHSSDAVPISGAPWDNGETSAGVDDDIPFLAVGSYPWAQSPWGLLDASGGQHEIIEDMDPLRSARIYHGSSQYQDFYSVVDRPDYWVSALDHAIFGVRFAAVVPAPISTYPICIVLVFTCVRRNR